MPTHFEHHGLSGHISTRRDRQQQVTDEHDEYTERDHLAEPVPVGQHSAKKRHKINRPEEHAEKLWMSHRPSIQISPVRTT